MKKRFLLIASLLALSNEALIAQQAPTGTAPPNPLGNSLPEVRDNTQRAWYRGGNFNVGTGGNNNIFGTMWNSPIYTVTNGVNRMKLNGTVNYPVNGYNGNRDGYLLLGQSMGTNYSSPTQGAASLLHLNGRISSNGFMAFLGHRPWMQTGITMTDNDDLSYFGLRKVGSGLDKTETTISWTNDVPGDFGSDDMVFRFLSGSGIFPDGTINPVGQTINNNLSLSDDFDGRHVARFTSDGRMGLGNTFGVNGTGDPVLYSRPQSLFHISYSDNSGIWSQYTNRGNAAGTTQGTGEAVSDGLRIGIFGNTNINANGIAGIYNHENRPLLLSTNATTHDKNPITGTTSERVRITSVSAPTQLLASPPFFIYNVFNPPGNLAAPNITRVSISHDPDNPVTRPLSLLHLGYNSTNYVTMDGWRPWMDVGMFISNKSDHVYLGLKNETNDNNVNRQDAVLSWGDNADNTGGNGPDNLRFIFTSATTAAQSPANSVNGLEVARMVPNTATTLAASNSGMMGVGNFSSTGPNAAAANQVNAKLDIDGDLRIRTVTSDITLTQVLVIDPTDKNRVHYRNVSSFGGTSPGGYCSSSPTLLASHYGIPLGGYNYYFPGQGGPQNSVGIGQPCGAILRDAKLEVLNQHKLAAGCFRTNFPQSNIPAVASATALMAHSFGYVTNNFMMVSRGVEASAMSVGGSYNNTGVFTTAQNGMTNYGIWASTQNPSSVDRAGYFQGLIQTTASYVQTSDSLFKTDVEDISNAISIVKRLNPKIYFMDTINFPKMNFDVKKQFGFIAQEVENVIPNVVYESFHPGLRDSLGNFIEEPIEFKSLNYNAIIPINTQAIKELNIKVDKQTLSDQTTKTNVQNLTGSLNKVLAMRGVSFNWNQNLVPEYELDNSEHVGFIAQEINAVDPRLTFISDENLMHVDYNKIVPIAVEAIQELNGQIAQRDSIITSLNDRLTHLENCLSGILPFLCQISNSAIQPTQEVFQQQLKNEINVQLSSKNTIILNQNVPNPFAEQTQISFSIPETVKKAQIHFYDANGKLINSVEVQERGLGQLNVFANDLSTGVYTYTLVADGQIVATKKMMKQ